jgi:molecular chaperone GrpE
MKPDDLPPADDKDSRNKASADSPDQAEDSPATSLPPEDQAPLIPAKNEGRKKSGEHKDSPKLKSLRAEIDLLKATLMKTTVDAESAWEENASLKKENLEWKDKTLRTLADTDNLRKRLEREKNEFFQFALTDILKDVLLVLDNLERALRAEDSSGGGFREGIELIRKQILDLVAKRGVTPIERPDGRFDPTVHQALSTEDAEGIEEPMVEKELQKGYLLNDRLLRPTLVKVLIPKKT